MSNLIQAEEISLVLLDSTTLQYTIDRSNVFHFVICVGADLKAISASFLESSWITINATYNAA